MSIRLTPIITKDSSGIRTIFASPYWRFEYTEYAHHDKLYILDEYGKVHTISVKKKKEEVKDAKTKKRRRKLDTNNGR